MKLLCWAHRKFRQNNNETPKDFFSGFTGQPSLDGHLQRYQKGGCGSYKPRSNAQRNNYYSFTSLEAAATRVEQEDDQLEEEAGITDDLDFHGFLAIGTLGTYPASSTPTFSISVLDHIAETETEATHSELKTINDELEKVLGGGVGYADDMSCTNVSSGRNSYCSTITLSGKPIIESAETYNNSHADGGSTTCPLQSYLFGSVKREHRTSLGELFRKTDENSGTKSERCEKKQVHKETDYKSAVNAMKKMLKGSRKSSSATETKIKKILRIFSRKVHPENANSCQNNHKPTKNEMKNNNTQSVASNCGGLRPWTEDIIIYPQRAIAKESTLTSCKAQSHHLPHLTKSSGDTPGNEFWVKTDADYLVLEL